VVHRFKQLAFAASLTLIATSALANNWPTRPITWVVPFGAGGNFDLIARIVAKEVGKDLKQAIIIQNKPGAGGVLGAAYVAHSKPDGYTFLVGGNGTVTNTLIRHDQPYKDEELTPVAPLAQSPSVTVIAANSPYKNLREFIDAQKAHHVSKVTFATAGVGSTPHFVAGLFKIASGLDISPIQYKSGLDTLLAVASGQVPLASESVSVVQPLVQAGRVKAVAVTLPTRSPLLPNVPTTKEQGLGTMQMAHFVGIWAPSSVPAGILDQMNKTINKALKSQDVQKTFASSGAEAVIQSRTQFAQSMKAERARLKKVVAAAGMNAQD